MNNQYKYLGQHLTARMSRELIQELFPGQTVHRQEIIGAVDEAHLERGGLPKRSIAHPVGSALFVMKADGLAESPEYGVWSILSETIDVNNQYQYSEQPLTPGIAQELIQELFEGQTVQKQAIANAVDKAHLERGGLAAEDPVTTALTSMKRSGLAENLESDLWSITSQTEERIRISTLDKFTKWAAQFDSGEGSEQYLFRGVSSADYKIDASAYRRIKKGRDSGEEQEGDFEKFLQINRDLIRDARFRGHGWKNGRELEDLEVLAEFQHYGAATFLMDFTYNALVALWFACKENLKESSKDGKVVAVTPNDPKFIGGTQEFSVITLDSLEKKIDEFSLDNKKLYQWQPRTQNERIIAQQSIFLFGVLEIEINPDKECIIDGSSKKKIRESLKRIHGITEDMLFPDFDGFARQHNQAVPYTQLTTAEYHQRAYQAHQRGEYAAAILDYNEVIGRNPNNAVAYYNRGLANKELQRYEAAINDFNESIHIAPDNAYSHYHRGLANNGLKRYEAAIDDFNMAISLPPNPKPDDVYTYHWRGNVNYILGRYEAAIDDYHAANRFHPNPNAEYSHHFCGLANNELERYQEAINNFDEAIRINPNDARYYHHRGLANSGSEKYEEAVNDFDMALHLDPNYAETYYYRADVNLSLRRLAEATNDLEIALPLAEQAGNIELIRLIQDLLYEINSRTSRGVEENE